MVREPREMINILAPLIAAIIVSAAAIVGSTSILLLGRNAERAALWILAFAIGTLLGGAALHLLPEALERRATDEVMLLFVSGIILFIALERMLRWRHTHSHGDDELHHAVTAQVLLWGDALHNFIDGIILGVTFSVSLELGVIATVAVFAHEVPQEIGDFAVLLDSGMPKKRAMLLNYACAATVIPGAVVASLWSDSFRPAIGWLLPLAAGGLVYIALADLVPSLHHRRGAWSGALQIFLVILGVAVIYGMGVVVHHE